jgi:hypothetical protein
VEWAKITHMKVTATMSTTIQVSRTRITDSRLCGPGPHRAPSALGSAR